MDRQQFVKNVLQHVYKVDRIDEISSQGSCVRVRATVLVGRVIAYETVLQSSLKREWCEEPVNFEVYFDKLKDGDICAKFKTYGMYISDHFREYLIHRMNQAYHGLKADIYESYSSWNYKCTPILRVKGPEKQYGFFMGPPYYA